jgi:hypothetical protein
LQFLPLEQRLGRVVLEMEFDFVNSLREHDSPYEKKEDEEPKDWKIIHHRWIETR